MCSTTYKSSRCSQWMSLTISYTRSAMYKSARGSRLTSLSISYTRSTTYKSVRGSRWTSLTSSYTRSATYKSVRGSRMTFQPSLILFTRARGSRSMLHIASIFCSSADIIINGLARPLTPQPVSQYSSECERAIEHEIIIYHDWVCRPRSTHKLHRLTTNQPTPHHDGRIDKKRSTTYDQYTDPEFSHLIYLKYL
jgi:hypothetical protein